MLVHMLGLEFSPIVGVCQCQIKRNNFNEQKRLNPGLTPEAPRRETGLAEAQVSGNPPRTRPLARPLATSPIGRGATLRILARSNRKLQISSSYGTGVNTLAMRVLIIKGR